MKHHFHILIAGALLLGSLIIFHNHKSEAAGNLSELSLVELTELSAELPVQQISQTPIQLNRLHSCLHDQIFSGDIRKAAYPHAASCRMRMKTQMNIFLEQKPVLVFRSGQYLCHLSSYGDPPGFIA